MKRKFLTEEAREFFRLHVWKHNGLLGNIGVIRKHLNVLRSASSITPAARDTLVVLEGSLDLLRSQIRGYRMEPNGDVSEIKHKEDL